MLRCANLSMWRVVIARCTRHAKVLTCCGPKEQNTCCRCFVLPFGPQLLSIPCLPANFWQQQKRLMYIKLDSVHCITMTCRTRRNTWSTWNDKLRPPHSVSVKGEGSLVPPSFQLSLSSNSLLTLVNSHCGHRPAAAAVPCSIFSRGC